MDVKYWKITSGILAVSTVVMTGLFCVSQYNASHSYDSRREEKQRISPAVDYVVRPGSNASGFIRNVRTGEVLTEDVDWIAMSHDGDSLIVFSSKGKRGYLNRFTGKPSIVPKFSKAWVFSGGLAAVADGDCVYFIGHDGKPVNQRRFKYDARCDGYVYHGGYCAVAGEDGKAGLIDKEGNWSVPPKYDIIQNEWKDYWKARIGNGKDGLWYVIDDKARILFEEGYPAVTIDEERGITVTGSDKSHKTYSFEYNKPDSEQILQLCN